MEEHRLSRCITDSIEEAQRVRFLVHKCHDAARRALAAAKKEKDGARADRYLEAATRLVAMRNLLMRQAQETLLAGGRALRAAGG